jgi:hypothetical protein
MPKNPIRQLLDHGGFGLLAGLVVELLLGSLTATGIISVQLAVWLLAIAFLLGAAAPFFTGPAWFRSTKSKIVTPVVLFVFLVSVLLYERTHIQAPSSASATPATTVCPNAKDSTCFGNVNGPVTINPKTQTESYVGTLGSSDKIFLAPGEALPGLLAIGEFNAPFLMWGPDGHPAKPNGLPIFTFFNRYRLVIESVNGKLAVSTRVGDRTGALLAEINKNDWQTAHPPKIFDLNHDDNALEVIDDRGEIILQVVAFPGLICLQGEWWDDEGNGIRLVSEGPKNAGFVKLSTKESEPPGLPKIQAIFVYPSQIHPGELTAFGQTMKHWGQSSQPSPPFQVSGDGIGARH